MTDLTDLIARVEGLSGPDREIERDVWEALTGECVHRETKFVYLDDDERELECVACGADTYGKDPWRGISASLDAVVALAERVLPGWGWGVAVIEARVTAMLVEPDTPDASLMTPWPRRFESTAPTPTPTLALLLALLRAVQAQQETEA